MRLEMAAWRIKERKETMGVGAILIYKTCGIHVTYSKTLNPERTVCGGQYLMWQHLDNLGTNLEMNLDCSRPTNHTSN